MNGQPSQHRHCQPWHCFQVFPNMVQPWIVILGQCFFSSSLYIDQLSSSLVVTMTTESFAFKWRVGSSKRTFYGRRQGGGNILNTLNRQINSNKILSKPPSSYPSSKLTWVVALLFTFSFIFHFYFWKKNPPALIHLINIIWFCCWWYSLQFNNNQNMLLVSLAKNIFPPSRPGWFITNFRHTLILALFV